MSSPLYRTQRWLKKRRAQLTAEPLCRYCARLGRTKSATVADHIIPHNGDESAFWCNELQSLCAECHSGTKQQLERTGSMRGGDIAGMPDDPSHHWNRDTPADP